MNFAEQIGKTVNLSPSIALLPRVISVLKDPDSNTNDLVEIISMDPTLTAELLKTSNSAFFSTGSPVSSIDDAVNRIGFKETYYLVSSLASKTLMKGELPHYGIEKGEIWKDSVVAARISEFIARKVNADPSTAYITGLLRNIGKLVLNDISSLKENLVFDKIENEAFSLEEAENSIIGISYPEIAAQLLEAWKFPPTFVEPIRHQNSPLKAGEHVKAASVLHLTNFVLCSLGTNPGKFSSALPFDDGVLEILNLSEDEAQNLFIDSSSVLKDAMSYLEKF